MGAVGEQSAHPLRKESGKGDRSTRAVRRSVACRFENLWSEGERKREQWAGWLMPVRLLYNGDGLAPLGGDGVPFFHGHGAVLVKHPRSLPPPPLHKVQEV